MSATVSEQGMTPSRMRLQSREHAATLREHDTRIKAIEDARPVQQDVQPAAGDNPTREEFNTFSAKVTVHQQAFAQYDRMVCTSTHLVKSILVPANDIGRRVQDLGQTVQVRPGVVGYPW